MEESTLLTTTEAARYLRVHPETLRNWARRGQIPAAKFGNRGGYRFTREVLDDFVSVRVASRSLSDEAASPSEAKKKPRLPRGER
jgi:PTS system nitrogen regulatory IIA component